MKPGYFRKPSDSAATSHLFIANCGPAVGISESATTEFLSQLGATRIVLLRDSIVCASFEEQSDACRAKEELACVKTAERFQRQFVVRYADYVGPEPEKEQQKIFTTSEEAGVEGLLLIKEFITPEEEQELVKAVDRSAWEELANRRVQHYGFRFGYKTRNVDISKPIQPFPEAAAALKERLKAVEGAPDADQLTVNEYPRGVGLAPHVDTHSAFTGGIASLSLVGSCVMEFRLGEERKALFLPQRSLLVMHAASRYRWQHYIPHRKADLVEGVTIPRAARRVSLTYRKVRGFPCDCRFPEQCDSQAGSLPPTRLQQLDLEALPKSKEEELGQNGSRESPPATSSSFSEPPTSKMVSLNASGEEIEAAHVHAVYELIALHFSSTRFAVWPKVREFLLRLPQSCVLADVGCGNGKYFAVRPDLIVLGSDRSFGLAAQAARLSKAPKSAGQEQLEPDGGLHSAQNHAEQSVGKAEEDAAHPHIGSGMAVRAPKAGVIVADALKLPYKDCCADAVTSIAVLHHISTVQRRVQLLREVLRILRPGGRALVTVWAAEQEDKTKMRKWEQILAPSETAAMQDPLKEPQDEVSSSNNASPEPTGDYFVPWHVPFHRASAAKVLRDRQGNPEGSSQGGGVIDTAKSSVKFQRYYHLFREGELEELVRQLPCARIVDSFYDKSNWCCIFERSSSTVDSGQ